MRIFILQLIFQFFSVIKETYPRAVWLLAPCLWVAHEYTITHLLTGFPWGLLGYSQYQNLYFLQTASLLGVYGLSFILILFQCGFLYALIRKKRSPFFTKKTGNSNPTLRISLLLIYL